MKSLLQIILSGSVFLTVSGCAMIQEARSPSYETVVANPQRDTEKARVRNAKAIRLFHKGDIAKARVEADQALIANVDYAPAHNTLGRILYCQGKYYLAAWEYQFAIQLQPNVPEYHNNLGMVYEAADRLPEAISEFQTAVDFDSKNHHFVSNLARAMIRQGNVNPETASLLRDVVYLDPRKEWKDWARELLNTSHSDQAGVLMESQLLPDMTPQELLNDQRNPVENERPQPLEPSETEPELQWEALSVPDSIWP